MAPKPKRENLISPFTPTAPRDAIPEEAAEDKVVPRGIGLKASEWKRLEEIGQELDGKTPHSLVMYAVRDFLRRYDAGEIEIHTKVSKSLPDL